MLFRTGPQPSVHALVGVEEESFFEWLDNGSRIVAYNWAGRAYEIRGIDGASADRLYATFAPQAPAPPFGRKESAHVLPGGAAVVLQSDPDPPRIYDVASGTLHPFAGPPGQNVNVTGTADGARLIFNNVADGGTVVMIADLDGAHARVLVGREEEGSVGMIDNGALSPDGKHLLLSSWIGEGIQRKSSYIVTDMNGETIWRLPVPDAEGNVASDVRWAGADRLLTTQTRPIVRSEPVIVASTFVFIPSGAETAAPEMLATRLVSLSPDGQHAIMLLGESATPWIQRWKQRCALVSIDAASGSIEELAAASQGPGDYQTVFCASVDWTADGRQAIVSAGGI